MSPLGRRRSAGKGPETAETLLRRLKLPFQRVRVDAVQCLDPTQGPLLTTVTYESVLISGKPYSYGEQHLFWYDLGVRDGYVDVQAGFASRPGSTGKSLELRAASALIVRDLQSALAGLTDEATRRETGG